MKLFNIATYDRETKIYGRPITVNSLGGAVRSFGDMIQGKGEGDPVLLNHPDHFELHKLADWDDETGEYSNDKQVLALGTNYKKA